MIPYPVTGYTPTVQVELPSRAQLTLLRDALLGYGDLNAAAACDNLIDILWHVANTAENVKVVSNPALNGSVRRQIGYGELMHDINDLRYLNERKAQADAICEEYEEANRVSDNFNFDTVKEIPF